MQSFSLKRFQLKFILFALSILVGGTEYSFARYENCGPNKAPPCMNGDWLQCPGSVYYSDLRPSCPVARTGVIGKGMIHRPQGIKVSGNFNGPAVIPKNPINIGGQAPDSNGRYKDPKGNGWCNTPWTTSPKGTTQCAGDIYSTNN
jgi:hypothetical protein